MFREVTVGRLSKVQACRVAVKTPDISIIISGVAIRKSDKERIYSRMMGFCGLKDPNPNCLL